jgi:hypothetical protein
MNLILAMTSDEAPNNPEAVYARPDAIISDTSLMRGLRS